MTPPDEPDPLTAYVAGDPDAVRAAAPTEPSDAQWEATRRRIRARLAHQQVTNSWRSRVTLLAGLAALVIAVVAVAWAAFDRTESRPNPGAPEVAGAKLRPVAPVPHEPTPDPLDAFPVLPMASADEVVLHRVPGDGWLPVGAHPLPGALALATAEEVELDDPDPTWPNVTPAPGYAPMVFAAKPR